MHSGATRVEYNDRKEAIMEAAIRVFATIGYHRATTADVSREAGISQPYVYRFFATKEALFLEGAGTRAVACAAVVIDAGCCVAEATGVLCYKTDRGVESTAEEGKAAPAGGSYISPDRPTAA